jgi:hypothetical protein
MPQINLATRIPQIYDTTIIVGACRVNAPNARTETGAFDPNHCYWREACMDMERLTGRVSSNETENVELGCHQSWISVLPKEGFLQTHPSDMIDRILEHILDACDLARQKPLPSPILVILYGPGNPALGCYMNCSKSFHDPAAVLTPSRILQALPRDCEVTLAMRMTVPLFWGRRYAFNTDILDTADTPLDIVKVAAADGRLTKQAFPREDEIWSYRFFVNELHSMHRHHELALLLQQYPQDTDGILIIDDRI